MYKLTYFFMAIILVIGLLPLDTVQAVGPEKVSVIIVFTDPVDPASKAQGLAKAYGLETGFIYEYALAGMSASVPVGRLEALKHDPRVAYVVDDLQRSINAQTVPTGIQRIFAVSNGNIDIDGSDDNRVDVDVAVIDTGIDFQHPDLNVVRGVTCDGNWRQASCSEGGDDNHYHGTHVAGTIGAIDNGIGVVGVAPGARLWAVKVLDASGSGWSSEIIAGIDWVTANAFTIEVANMSLGGSGFSQAEYDAIQGAVNAGVAFAVAAGNNDNDANYYSPGGFDNVLSVSALADFNGLPFGGAASTCRTDQDDTLADFSNWGPEVDITAPGVCILSTYPLEQGEYGTISGTSMASPHAAGALALLASSNNPNDAAGVEYLYNMIKSAGNYDWTDDSGDGIQEPLLDVSSFNPVMVPGSGGGETNTPPTVIISLPANGANFALEVPVTFEGTGTDAEDGDLTTFLNWTSSLDGPIGIGGSFVAVLSQGDHTITASVNDSKGLSGSASITMTVTDNGAIGNITVVSLNGNSVTVNKNFWKATVVVTIEPALAGAVISGNWDNGNPFTCTTDGSGTCSGSTNVRTKMPSITLTINDIALAGYVYVPGVITSVTVAKP